MFVVYFFCNTLKSNDILCGVTSGLIFSSDQSAMNLLNIYVSRPSTHQERLFYWSIYLTVFHMIGRTKINERLCEMTPNRCYCITRHFCFIKIQQTSNFNSNMTSFFHFVNKRAIYRLGIISLAHLSI